MRIRAHYVRFVLTAVLLMLAPSLTVAQGPPSPLPVSDSVVVVAGARYKAGALKRWLLGSTYRDVWTTPVRVPVVNLRTFAGGLRPLKESGGNQTKSLRLVTPDGNEYVFRMVDKDKTQAPKWLEGSIVDKIFQDQVSTSHPAAALAAAPIFEAAGVLHPTPVFAVLPNDTLLGKFSSYSGRLGMLEEYPNKPKHGKGFAGAHKIIDSDELLQLIDSDPHERVDARALLAARLMDMLLNDWDRHGGQWKWARFQPGVGSPWEPIGRDRDKVFVSSGGLLPEMARHEAPNLVSFQTSYPSVVALTWNSLDFDRRMLGGLEKPVWDSVAATLVRRVTDSVIDSAMRAMPPEYRWSAPSLARTLKKRRDGLPDAATRFYLALATVADIHATDAADRAIITRGPDRSVEVRLEAEDGTPYFRRRYDARETSQIRVYLHGGDDSAVVTGRVQQSIPIRIIGGNGTNRLIESSTVGGHPHQARLYDVGHVEGIRYPVDTFFNRRPLVKEYGRWELAGRDHGTKVAPVISLGINRDYGIVPVLGVKKYQYAFRKRPYSNVLGLQAEYSTNVGGFRITLTEDKRRESSPVHLQLTARMSQLEIINFFGFGNETPGITPGDPTTFYQARQRQWLLQPALARSFGPRSDLAFGPVVQYSTADTTSVSLLSALRPYGVGNFGQAGLRLSLHHDTRDAIRDPRRGLLLDLTGSFFPALWDVTSQFGSIAAGATIYLKFPIPVHPTLVLRGGGKKVYGTYPFHEAAFLGGRSMLRSLDANRYAGDAAVYGSAELRVRVAHFVFLLPVDAGIFGVADVGRVYYNGDSPGGWHKTAGLGFWIGVPDPSTALRVCRRMGASGPC